MLLSAIMLTLNIHISHLINFYPFVIDKLTKREMQHHFVPFHNDSKAQFFHQSTISLQTKCVNYYSYNVKTRSKPFIIFVFKAAMWQI